MNLYDELNTNPDADADELKAAYRRAAKKHHPDAGGDREAFERVNRAWMVLQDPSRRAKYDATGETDSEPDNQLGMIMGMMNAAFDDALGKAHGNFEQRNIVALMTEYAEENITHVTAEIRKGKKALKKYDGMIDRATFKGKGQNMIAALLKERRSGVANQIHNLERSLDGYGELVKLLADYDWKVDDDGQLDIEALLAAAENGATLKRGRLGRFQTAAD